MNHGTKRISFCEKICSLSATQLFDTYTLSIVVAYHYTMSLFHSGGWISLDRYFSIPPMATSASSLPLTTSLNGLKLFLWLTPLENRSPSSIWIISSAFMTSSRESLLIMVPPSRKMISHKCIRNLALKKKLARYITYKEIVKLRQRIKPLLKSSRSQLGNLVVTSTYS